MKQSLLLVVVIIIAVAGFFGWRYVNVPEGEPAREVSQASESPDPSEQEFNDSGRAKAIENETDLWTYYEDEDAGFSIRYPHDVAFNDQSDEEQLRLMVRSEAIASLDYTMGFDRETALANRASLSGGEYGKDVDWPLEVSKKVTTIDGTNGQEFMVLARFEVCSVTFERTLYFFSRDRQVVISLVGPRGLIQQSMPAYFKTDPDNCGQETVWDLERHEQFYGDLASGQGSEIAQRWFDTFDRIVETVDFFRE